MKWPPPARRPPHIRSDLTDVEIAVHTHRIVRATLAEKAARLALRQAIAEAEAAGIPARVLRRALRRQDPRERRLDQEADSLLEVAESLGMREVGRGV